MQQANRNEHANRDGTSDESRADKCTHCSYHKSFLAPDFVGEPALGQSPQCKAKVKQGINRA
jgi:hypothetical protein